MPRSCKDAMIGGSTSNYYVFPSSPAQNRVLARCGSATLPRSCYAWGMDTSTYVEIGRYDASGAWTRLARGSGVGANGAFALRAVGTLISGTERIGQPAMIQVTDSMYPGPGDWRVQTQYPDLAWEVSFECYDAPAPSGLAHPVIGSGIINSRAIVRSAA